MLKTDFECIIKVQDQNTGFWKRKVVTGNELYTFTMEFASALFIMMGEAELHRKATEFDEMEEQSELPF